MKIAIHSTEQITEVNGVPGRVWEGESESGIPVLVLVTRVAVPANSSQAEFERELTEHAPPSLAAASAFGRVVYVPQTLWPARAYVLWQGGNKSGGRVIRVARHRDGGFGLWACNTCTFGPDGSIVDERGGGCATAGATWADALIEAEEYLTICLNNGDELLRIEHSQRLRAPVTEAGV